MVGDRHRNKGQTLFLSMTLVCFGCARLADAIAAIVRKA